MQQIVYQFGVFLEAVLEVCCIPNRDREGASLSYISPLPRGRGWKKCALNFKRNLSSDTELDDTIEFVIARERSDCGNLFVRRRDCHSRAAPSQ